MFTPAKWRENFAGGRTLTVHLHGSAVVMVGDLETGPARSPRCSSACSMVARRPQRVGLPVAPGHRIGSADVASIDRAVITLRTN